MSWEYREGNAVNELKELKATANYANCSESIQNNCPETRTSNSKPWGDI